MSCVALWMAMLPSPDGGAARADSHEHVSILEENDSLYFNSDRHYTQGLRFSYLGPDIAAESSWNRPFAWAGRLAPIFQNSAPHRSRRYAVFLGQSIFTPEQLRLSVPDPHDRPYAGWLYLGTSLLQESGRRSLENLEVELGVVGPAALGRMVQNDYHRLVGLNPARGWAYQLHNEPGIALSYDRLWRVPLVGTRAYGLDVIPEAGATVGNVFTYAESGALLRVGKNLGIDYGPVHVRPALSGTDYTNTDDADGGFGFYFYIGAQGRIVGRNIFLDGNSFQHSASVRKKTFVADLDAGVALFWTAGLRLDLSVGRRTPEFDGQQRPDVMGTATLSLSW